MVLTDTGLAKVFQRIKSFVIAQLNSKASAVHTHTVSDISDLSTNYVTTDTTQTIPGEKTFTSTPVVKKDSAGDLLYLIDDTINTSSEDENGLPLTGHTNSLKIRGHDTNMIPCMLTGQLYTNGDTSAELRTYKYKDISSSNCRAILSLRYIYNSNYGIATFSNVSIVTPNVTNTANLGSPPLQWNTTYTRNILIDNDINIASSLINKTSSSGVLSIRGGLTTPDGASIGLYGKDYNGAIAGNIYMTAYGNSDYTNFRIYPNGTMSVYNNSTATTKNVAMQEDVVNLTTAQTVGGQKTFTSNMVFQGGKKVTCNLDNSFIELDGGTTWGKGGSIVLSGQDRSSYTNSVLIVSKSDTNTDILQYQNGELKPHPNNTNNSSLGTSTSKWSKVYSDDVVHTTGDETISGNKYFNGNYVDVNGYRFRIKNTGEVAGELPTAENPWTSNRWTGFNFVDKNNVRTFEIARGAIRNGWTFVNIGALNNALNTWVDFLKYEGDSSVSYVSSIDFVPRSDNTYELGSSTNKWKSFNGINPGALSLPSISNTGANVWIELDTTDWVKNASVSGAQKYIPLADGWLNVRVDNATLLAIAVGGNYLHQIIRSETANSLALLMPVYKDVQVAIMVGGNDNLAYNRVTFYPCQGNV